MIKDLCSSEIIILSHFSGLTLKLLVQYSLMNSSRMSVIFSVGSTIFRLMLLRLIDQMGYANTAWKWIVIPNITYNMKMLIHVYPFHYANEAFSIFHSNTMIRNDTSSIHELLLLNKIYVTMITHSIISYKLKI